MGTASRRRLCFNVLLVVLAFSVGSTRARMNSSFMWGFIPSSNSTVLPECGLMHLKAFTQQYIHTAAQPPYTLIAYEPGGIATAQTLGSDALNLWWTVDHKAGAQLILNMADAAGNSGGVAPSLYTVVSSSTTNSSCHPLNPTSALSFTYNVTKSISTCDVLSLKISGGRPPYTVTIASTEDALVTNVTMGSSYDTYNWVSRASPNSSLIATVSDATGAYAPGTPVLNTTGGLDHICSGMLSKQLDSAGKEAPVPLGNPTPSASTSNSMSGVATAPIIGGVLGGLAILGVFITAIFFLLRKRRPSQAYLDENGGYTEAGLRGIVPFQVSTYAGSQGQAGTAQFTSSREKALALEPGDGTRPRPQEAPTVYQHADISDVVELPPAYRDRVN